MLLEGVDLVKTGDRYSSFACPPPDLRSPCLAFIATRVAESSISGQLIVTQGTVSGALRDLSTLTARPCYHHDRLRSESSNWLGLGLGWTRRHHDQAWRPLIMVPGDTCKILIVENLLLMGLGCHIADIADGSGKRVGKGPMY